MRSIAVATVWEYWRRTRAPLATAASIGVGLPTLLFEILRLEIPLDDPTMLRFQFIFYMFDIFILCCILCGSQALGPGLVEKSRRLYQLPLTSASLVAGQLMCGMAAAALCYLTIVGLLNVLFSLNWPLWEPALLAATVYACVQAAIWLPTNIRILQLIALTAVSTPLFFWVKSKFGPLWGDPRHAWIPSSAGEVATMLGLIGIAYLMAVWSIGRDRSGRTQTWFGFTEWLDRPTARPRATSGFRSPQRAQFWYEWRQKGWIMPGLLLFFMLVLLVGYRFGEGKPTDLVEAFRAFGAALVIFGGVVSLLLGNAQMSSKSRGACGAFLGTRPMTDTALSAAVLEMSAVSLLFTWLLWMVGTAAATLWLWACEGLGAVRHAWNISSQLEGPSWMLFFFGMLMLAWTAMAAFVPLAMSGRHRLIFSVLTLGPTLLVAFATAVKLMLLPEYVEPVQRAAAYLVSFVMLCGIAVAVRQALQNGHISLRTVGLGLALWIVAYVAFVANYRLTPLGDPVALTMLATAWAVCLSPLATGPLAMAWNRHR